MRMETVLYIIQIVSLVIVFICTVIMTARVRKAFNYMFNYCKSHGSNKNTITREFKKVMKILEGK